MRIRSGAPRLRSRLSRRDLVRLGLIGTGAAVAGGALWHQERRSDVVASRIFKGDAPDPETWRRWRERGWAREAQHYRHVGRNVQCGICPNECELEPGDRSRCRNRVALEGKLFTMAYGNPCALNVDPVEKKPLFHFLPGSRAFSLATAGCSLRCLNCQNWEISQKTPEETKDLDGRELRPEAGRLELGGRGDVARLTLLPADVVQMARASGSRSIAYTYSEPICAFEYVVETARLARQAGIANVLVSNGYLKSEPLGELAEVIDAANVDLKSFSEETYNKLNGGKLQPVLDTLRGLRQRGVWVEVTNLVVPQHSDDLEEIGRMAKWLAANLGRETPLHLSRFHPDYQLEHLPPTPVRTLVQARQLSLAAGLHHVYLGNVSGVADATTTTCPGCGQPVLVRRGYQVVERRVSEQGLCQGCQARVGGVWRA